MIFFIFLLAAIIIFYFYSPDLLLHPASHIYPGDGILNFSWLSHVVRSIDHLDFANFWNGNIFYPVGSSVAFSDNLLFQGLIGYLPYKFGVPLPVVFNYEMILFLALNMHCMARFIKKLGWSWRSSVIGAAFGSVHYYWFCHLGHYQLTPTFWYPLIFTEIYLFAKHPNYFRKMTIFGSMIGLAASSPYLFVLFFPAILIFISIMYLSNRQHANQWWSLGWQSLLPANCLIGFFYLPYLRLAKSFEATRNFAEQKLYSSSLKDIHNFTGLLWPSRWFHNSRTISEGAMYISMVERAVIILGVLTIIYKCIRYHKMPKDVRALSIAFFLFVLLFLARLGPDFGSDGVLRLNIWKLMCYLPGFSGIRTPGRLAPQVLYILGFIAAWVTENTLPRQHRPTHFVYAFGLMALYLVELTPLERSVPEIPWRDYLDISQALKTKINNSKEPFLWLPIHDDNPHFVAISTFLENPLVNGNSGFTPSISEQFIWPAVSPCVDSNCLHLLRTLHVKYIVVRKPVDSKSFDFLMSQPSVSKVWDKNEVFLFRIPDAEGSPRLYQSNAEFFQRPWTIELGPCYSWQAQENGPFEMQVNLQKSYEQGAIFKITELYIGIKNSRLPRRPILKNHDDLVSIYYEHRINERNQFELRIEVPAKLDGVVTFESSPIEGWPFPWGTPLSWQICDRPHQ